MTSRISFALAATETLIVPGGNQSNAFALPAVDGSNTDLMISHTNSSPIYLNFGPGAVANPQGAGMVSCLPGVNTLLTSNAVVLAAAKDQLVQGGPQAALAGSQTTVAVWSPGGTTVTFTRGTATATVAF